MLAGFTDIESVAGAVPEVAERPIHRVLAAAVHDNVPLPALVIETGCVAGVVAPAA
jgi:hypothetical protein